MPRSLVHYWTMWNEPDLQRVRQHLDRAVSEEVVWVDPQHAFTGRDALEANVAALRSAKPQYRFVIASAVDGHHDRLRYRWNMVRGRRVLVEGLDVVQIAPDGLVARVDGFFGQLPPAESAKHGIPATLLPN